MFEDKLVEDTINDALEKLDRAIIKYAFISKEVDDINKRQRDLSLQLEDAYREIERLQGAHVELIVKKIHSN